VTVRLLRLFVCLAAAVCAVAPIPPAVVERWYSLGVYAALQPHITSLSSLVSFALLDVAAGVLAAGTLVVLTRRWRTSRFIVWLRQTLALALVSSAVVYLWFLSFWGFNYRRIPLEDKLAYAQSRISRDAAFALGKHAVSEVNGLAAVAHEWIARNGGREDDEALAAALAEVQRQLGNPHRVRVAQPKASLLTWYFRKAAIDGMTDPFFLEIILTPDLLPFERPHTLSHEWAHLAGYADESEANFVAWLTCLRSTPVARYSGWLAAYQHLAGALPREDRKVLGSALAPIVVDDLAATARRLAQASPTLRTAARGAYDSYLRANRIEEGIANYGTVVRLMLGTSFTSDWTPQLRQ